MRVLLSIMLASFMLFSVACGTSTQTSPELIGPQGSGDEVENQILPPDVAALENIHKDRVAAVIEAIGPFDIYDRDAYPTMEEIGVAVSKVMDLPERRFIQVNDPNCNPELKAPFPIFIRGTYMSVVQQYQYFAGHITLAMCGTFEGIGSSGHTGAEVYWVFYDVFEIYNEMIPGDGWVGYMTDVQETNRFGTYCLHTPNCAGQCGYNVPEFWEYDECPLEVPTER